MLKTLRRASAFVVGAVLVVSLSAGGYFAGGVAAGTITRPATPTPEGDSGPLDDLGLFWEVWDIIERDFAGEVPPPEEYGRGAARGLLEAMGDSATGLIAPEFAELEREDSSGLYCGIGASVRASEDGYVELAAIFEGSPAEESGIEPGDVLLAVDGEDIQGVSVYEVISLIRGEAGTRVELLLRRVGLPDPFTRVVERRQIEIPTVTLEMLPEGIAHLTLTDFNNVAVVQLRDQLRRAMDEEAVGIVLDLRHNPGGFLEQAIAVSDEFLDRATVLIERGREIPEKRHYSRDGGLATEIPLVVLVDGGSASASEIVAGAVQANGRGTVMGTRTFGKGSVQYAFDLSDGSQIRVTTALWYTPDDQLIQGLGLAPDVEVTDDEVTEADEQLEAAAQYLREMVRQ